MPDCFEPPNGVLRSRRNQEFTQVIPTSICAATRWARVRLSVQIEVASPYGLSLASVIASSSLSHGVMWQHGPKISSRMTDEFSGNPVQIVGSTNEPAENGASSFGVPPPITM